MSYHTIVNDPSGKEVRTTPQIGSQGATPDRRVAVPGPSGTTVPQSVDNRGATGTVPESMQIQQETLKKNPPPAELITKGSAPASEGTATVNSPLETNRIDPASPSRQRLQIDDTAAVRPQDPGAPSSLTPNEGASTGTSGSASPARVLPSVLLLVQVLRRIPLGLPRAAVIEGRDTLGESARY
jgi:hypothetical protein